MSKIASLRSIREKGESIENNKCATSFVLFVLELDAASSIDDMVVQFKLFEKARDDSTIVQDEQDLDEDLLLLDISNEEIPAAPVSVSVPVTVTDDIPVDTTADVGLAETAESEGEPVTPAAAKKTKCFIPMQPKKVGSFQVPSAINKPAVQAADPHATKPKKVIPMVAKKTIAIAAAASKKASSGASVKGPAKSQSSVGKEKKAAKAKRDPLAPKQAVNAYMFFAAKQRTGKVLLYYYYYYS